MSALVPFGFSALESDVYARLVEEPSATGYRIAQGLRKPAANVYKAIQTLAAKGAVILEDGAEPARARPVPPDELLDGLGRRRAAELESARTDLTARATPIPPGPALHRVAGPEAARAKALAMAVAAEREIVGGASSDVKAELEEVAEIAFRLGEGPLLLVADGREALVESPDGAFLTSHPTLVAVLREAALLRIVRDALAEGAGGKKIARLLMDDAPLKAVTEDADEA